MFAFHTPHIIWPKEIGLDLSLTTCKITQESLVNSFNQSKFDVW